LLDEELQKLTLLHSLKTLVLEGCDLAAKLQMLASILQNTAGLEKLDIDPWMVDPGFSSLPLPLIE
jgi:hypothetical protein